ncbi:MAG: alpha/beta fold hydrolase [Actinomycetota bacterium]|nr:alpha/beta fold hydrolase [Actinomycetota bacterium]
MSAPTRVASLEHEGLTFDVFDEGPVDGEVVVLLHGFPERSTSWRKVAPALHERGYRTVALDQRGYSPGARPPRRRDYRLTLLSADVEALVERIGEPVHLVGHDWGAAVAWTVATRRPDLLRTLTAFSVPHTRAYLQSTVTSRQFLKSWYMVFFQLPAVPELAARSEGGPLDWFLRRSGMTRADVARFRAEMVEDGALVPALNWYRAIPFLDRDLVGGRVTVPTTFVWSDQDGAIARAGGERTEKYVDAPYEFVVLEGISHWIPTQAPDACADAILARIAS